MRTLLSLLASGAAALWACYKPPAPVEPVTSRADALNAWINLLEKDGPLITPTYDCIPLEGRREHFVGSLSYHNDSFGCAAVFTVRSGQVDKTWWIKNCDCAVYSIRCVTLSGPTHPLIELISHTGHGNGTVQLYSFEHEQLKEALQTRAYDDHDDGMILEPTSPYDSGKLERTYADLDGDGLDDVLLTGWALSANDEKCDDLRNHWQRRERVQKAFAFDTASGTFLELDEWRLGPEFYHDEELWRGIELAG